MGQTFRQNRSMSHCFRDKCVFAFYVEIQDGRQKWSGENNFWGKSPADCRYPAGQKFCQNHSISHSYREDGHQKWRENDFWEKSPVDSADTLWVINFVKIPPSRTVYEINVLLYFTQKFKMAAKYGGKNFWQ